MKILLAGDWHSDVHERPASRALVQLGHEVVEFGWSPYFFRQHEGWMGRVDALQRRAQNKFLLGPELHRLNADLAEEAARERPDAVLIYRGTHIFQETLRRLRETVPGILLIAYCNDDPFSPAQSPRHWRHFLAGVPEYDMVFAYRRRNLDDFRRAGARRVELLRSWFIPELHRPVELDAESKARFGCDVVFVGHHEPDRRMRYLERLAKSGVDFRLFGPEWARAAASNPWLGKLGPIQPVRGEEYVKALCGAKIALCFLSTLNRDTYTRRCFEIPATGTMLMSEYSDDLATLFREGEEAVFFQDEDEMLAKIKRYLADDSSRRAVAAAGLRRVHEDGHDVVSRMRGLISGIAALHGAAA